MKSMYEGSLAYPKSKQPELLELKRIIRAKKLTRRKLAEKMGMSPSTLVQKILGRSSLTSEEIVSMSEILEISDGDMLRVFFPGI